MNKLLKKVAALTLGLSMAAGVGVAVSAGRKDAKPVSAESPANLSLSTKTWTEGSDYVSWSITDGSTSVATLKSSGTNYKNYLGGDSNNRTSSRFYNGGTVLITPASGVTLGTITFTATSLNYGNAFKNSTYTNATATINTTTFVVTITPTDGSTAISIAVTGTCGFTAATFAYTSSGGGGGGGGGETPASSSYVLTGDNFSKIGSGTSYADYNGTRTINDVGIYSYQCMMTNTSGTKYIQFKRDSTNVSFLTNTTSLGKITKITLSSSTDLLIAVSATAFSTGTSQPTGGTSVTSGSSITGTYGYFVVKGNASSGTPKTQSITVEYEAGFTVQFNVQGIGTAPGNQTIASGGKVEEPTAPTATGYSFGGWYKEAACTNAWNFSTDTVTAATTLYAKWSYKTSALTFNLNGGTGTAPTGKTATYGSAMPAYGQSAPTKTGYVFSGFYDGSGGTGTQYYTAALASAKNWDKDTTNTTTLYAKWTAKTSALTFNLNGGTGTAPTGKTATYGSAMPAYGQSAPTKTGHTFAGFYDGSGGTGTQYYTAGLASARTWDKDTTDGTTLYAKWTVDSYTVTGTISNGELSSDDSVNYNEALSITIVPDTANEYTYPSSIESVTMGGNPFNGYEYDSSDGSFYIEHVTGDVVIVAHCVDASATPCSVDYDLTNCSISNAPETIYSNEIKELQIVPDEHYKFPNSISISGIDSSKWTYDKDEGTILINAPDDDMTIIVECVAKDRFNINLDLTNVSKSSGPSGTKAVEEGEEVTIVFAASLNYGLPSTITVEMGEDTLTAGDDYTWTQGTGTLYLLELTDDLTVTISGVARDLTNGSLTLGTKKIEYYLGDDFEKPSTITANFNIAPLTVDVKNDVEVSGPIENGVVTGSGTITLTYTYEPTGSTQTASYSITVENVIPTASKYVKVTSDAGLTNGQYLIVYETESKAFDGSAAGGDMGTNKAYKEVTISSSEIAASDTVNAFSVTITSLTGGYTIYTSSGYYIGRTSSSNGFDKSTDTVYKNSISISSNNAIITGLDANGSATTAKLQYLNQSNSNTFRYYTSSQKAIQLYKFQQGVEKQLKWITAEVKSGSYYINTSVVASNFNVTAHYNDGTSETVTSNISITNGTLNNLGPNNVTLTYGGKSCVVSVTATYAPVSSVTLSTNSASIGLDESYSLSNINVTVNPSNANSEVTWDMVNDGGLVEDIDYTFDGDEFHSINPGSVVFRCKSVADNTKYDDFTLTIAGDPVADFVKASTSGFVGKSETLSFTYGNMDSEDIVISSGNTSYVTIGTISASEGSGTVVINFVGAGSTSVTIGDGSSTLDSVSVAVSADSVTSVTWSASNLDVWSGDALNTSSWNVQYEMASGDQGLADSYSIKLVGDTTETITSGYLFKGSDNGKTIHVEYGGVSTTSINVVVTQRINNVYADNMTSLVSDMTFSAACGGSGTADDGASWTVSSDGDESNFIAGAGIHYGTNSAYVQYIELENSDIAPTNGNKTITKIEVNARDAQADATLSVTVGGKAFGTSKSLTNTSTAYEFTGSAKGSIVIRSERSESMQKALYVLFVKVTYEQPSGTTTQIANSASHKEAQRVAVKFANAFNSAMAETENCTTGLDAAWSTCSSAYTTFLSEAAALGSTEEAYAKNLVKYATAQYSDDSGEACLERMMKTYEICVQKHGKTAFMSDLVSLGAPQVSPLVNIIGENTNTVAIIVIISMVSVTAIGGYFFLRKRKEN